MPPQLPRLLYLTLAEFNRRIQYQVLTFFNQRPFI
jgi:hypothetical protein